MEILILCEAVAYLNICIFFVEKIIPRSKRLSDLKCEVYIYQIADLRDEVHLSANVESNPFFKRHCSRF